MIALSLLLPDPDSALRASEDKLLPYAGKPVGQGRILFLIFVFYLFLLDCLQRGKR